jgi:hypothetical protein
MQGTYTTVRGAALVGLVHEVRTVFLARPPVAEHDPQLPNSLRLVTLEVFTAKATHEKLGIVGDILDADTNLPIEREAADIFVDASTAGAYLDDLVCEIVCQALADDPEVPTEDERRRSAASERS